MLVKTCIFPSDKGVLKEVGNVINGHWHPAFFTEYANQFTVFTENPERDLKLHIF